MIEKRRPLDDDVILVAGVDTQVFHGYVHCNAAGTITGIGNVIPKEILHFVALARAAAATRRIEKRRHAVRPYAASGGAGGSARIGSAPAQN